MTALIVMAVALATGAATMAGGWLGLSLKEKLPLVLAVSAGAVIGVALFDLAPEAITAGTPRFDAHTLLAVTGAGFFLYALLDRLLAHDGAQSDMERSAARGALGAASFSAHSLMDGLALGIAFQASAAIGIVVATAILAHDFADGLNTVNVVIKNGGGRGRALRWLALDAAAPVVGAGLSLLLHPAPGVLGLLLALFCGFFLHIGASHLLPDSQRARPGFATMLVTLAGAGFLFLVTLLA